MRIVYGSDLHLELNPYKQNLTIPDGDVLILAGDIMSASSIQKWKNDARSRKTKLHVSTFTEQTRKFKNVLYVMGNHEHYGCVFSQTINILKKYLIENNLNWKIMEDNIVDIDGKLFIGSTFWTDFNKHNFTDMLTAQNGMNDYYWIYKDLTTPIIPDIIYETNQNSIQFLETVCRENKDLETILITHHPLSHQGVNRMHSGNSLDSAFASNLETIYEKYPQITHHFHGHTHIIKEYEIYDTKIYSNACGYEHEKIYNSFEWKIIDI